MGGSVRKGEKSTLVTLWKVYEKKQDDGTIDKTPSSVTSTSSTSPRSTA